ncbi:MAG: hypothetical protein M1814_006036 [Vezdaea aestivalis]|nr:MAG: hypothetical protein M1814_006036 [Vezdaea aestivalis]
MTGSLAGPHSVHTRRSISSKHGEANSTPTEQEIKNAAEHCLNTLKRQNWDAYILHAFIEPAYVHSYIALQTFSTTLANIPDHTSNSALASLRYAFWDRIVSSHQAHMRAAGEPLALLLSSSLPSPTARQTYFLRRLIAARTQRVANAPIPTLSALEDLAENTYSSLYYLLLSTIPNASSSHTDHIASHLGKAAGLVATLRGIPIHAFPPESRYHTPAAAGLSRIQPFVALPLDVMAQAGVKEEDVLRRGPEADGLEDAVFEVACRAQNHIQTARKLWMDLKRGGDVDHEFENEGQQGFTYESDSKDGPHATDLQAALRVLLQGLPTALWLEKLQDSQFNVFDYGLIKTRWSMTWKAKRKFQGLEF